MPRPSEATIRRVQNQLRIAGRPSTFNDACAEMGRRGARKRKMRLTPSYYMNASIGRDCLPPGDR
jgi:hypothetical protein